MAERDNFFWQFYFGDLDRAARRWLVGIFAMLLLFPGVGSGGSILFVGLWLFALPYCIFDPGSRRLIASERILVSACAAYFLVMAGFALMHAAAAGRVEHFGAVYSNLPFLLVAPAFPVLRRAAREDWLPAVFAALACGAVLAAIIVTAGAAFSTYVWERGLSGNTLILALGALVSGLLCVHGAFLFGGRMRWLMVLGALAAIYVLLMTGSRGPLLSYFAAMTLYGVIMGQRYFGLRWMLVRIAGSLLLLAAVVAVIAQASPRLMDRYSAVVESLSNPGTGSTAKQNIHVRLVLYESALHAFLDRPLTGYGRQYAVSAVGDHSGEESEDYFVYSHLHNGYLTDLIASGVLGLLSLLAVLIAPLIVFWNARPVIFGGVLCLVLSYVFYGVTNLLFYHDVVTFLFLGLIVVFNALANVEKNGKQTVP